MNKKNVCYQFTAALLTLLFLEIFCYWQLKKAGSAFAFFINIQHSTEMEDAKKIGFNQIHPLWGWNMSDEVLQSHGYESTNNIIKLSTNHPADTSLRIFITGGSTSDIVLYKNNWPLVLHRLMVDSGVPHIIYVAAVGGFNSAQEYLRLIEQGLELKPHIHISYSGANETGDFGFVTEYESDFYTQSLNRSNTSFLLPNTVFYIRTKVLETTPAIELANLPNHTTAAQFQKNIKLMYAAGKQFGYKYFGILQPLNGIGKYRPPQPQKFNTDYTDDYKKYYPDMQLFAVENPELLKDFSAIFDSINTQVYVDDCHLTETGNKLVAGKFFSLIKQHAH